MRLSMAAVAAGLVASSVAHPHQAVEHEHKNHGVHAPRVLEGIIDENVVVVPTKGDMITPQNHRHHGHKHPENGGSGPIIIKNADGTLTIVEETETEERRNQHESELGSGQIVRVEEGRNEAVVEEPSNELHRHQQGGSGPIVRVDEGGREVVIEESNGVNSGSHGSNQQGRQQRAGSQPEKPIYVDIGTTLQNEPPLFPDNVFLTRREIQVFEELTKGIVQGQKALMECVPSMTPVCSQSLELWEKLAKLVPNYKVLRQVQYIEACTALRTALEHLSTVEKRHNPKLDAILWKLLLDNLLLAGYLDDVYDGSIIPNWTLDPPGEVIGALIHFIGIDVTKALNFWPVFTPYIYKHKQ